jgi:hypothetical protein
MGAQTGLELGKKGSDIAAYKELMNLKVVNLIPSSMESFDFFRDSVYNEKSRSYVPAAYSSLMVSVDSHDSVGKVVAKYLLIYLHLGFSLWAVVLFIRLIISINKSDIFNWRNVRRLRRLGMALVVSFCCTFASSYLDFIGIDTFQRCMTICTERKRVSGKTVCPKFLPGKPGVRNKQRKPILPEPTNNAIPKKI